MGDAARVSQTRVQFRIGNNTFSAGTEDDDGTIPQKEDSRYKREGKCSGGRGTENLGGALTTPSLSPPSGASFNQAASLLSSKSLQNHIEDHLNHHRTTPTPITDGGWMYEPSNALMMDGRGNGKKSHHRSHRYRESAAARLHQKNLNQMRKTALQQIFSAKDGPPGGVENSATPRVLGGAGESPGSSATGFRGLSPSIPGGSGGGNSRTSNHPRGRPVVPPRPPKNKENGHHHTTTTTPPVPSASSSTQTSNDRSIDRASAMRATTEIMMKKKSKSPAPLSSTFISASPPLHTCSSSPSPVVSAEEKGKEGGVKRTTASGAHHHSHQYLQIFPPFGSPLLPGKSPLLLSPTPLGKTSSPPQFCSDTLVHGHIEGGGGGEGGGNGSALHPPREIPTNLHLTGTPLEYAPGAPPSLPLLRPTSGLLPRLPLLPSQGIPERDNSGRGGGSSSAGAGGRTDGCILGGSSRNSSRPPALPLPVSQQHHHCHSASSPPVRGCEGSPVGKGHDSQENKVAQEGDEEGRVSTRAMSSARRKRSSYVLATNSFFSFPYRGGGDDLPPSLPSFAAPSEGSVEYFSQRGDEGDVEGGEEGREEGGNPSSGWCGHLHGRRRSSMNKSSRRAAGGGTRWRSSTRYYNHDTSVAYSLGRGAPPGPGCSKHERGEDGVTRRSGGRGSVLSKRTSTSAPPSISSSPSLGSLLVPLFNISWASGTGLSPKKLDHNSKGGSRAGFATSPPPPPPSTSLPFTLPAPSTARPVVGGEGALLSSSFPPSSHCISTTSVGMKGGKTAAEAEMDSENGGAGGRWRGVASTPSTPSTNNNTLVASPPTFYSTSSAEEKRWLGNQQSPSPQARHGDGSPCSSSRERNGNEGEGKGEEACSLPLPLPRQTKRGDQFSSTPKGGGHGEGTHHHPAHLHPHHPVAGEVGWQTKEGRGERNEKNTKESHHQHGLTLSVRAITGQQDQSTPPPPPQQQHNNTTTATTTNLFSPTFPVDWMYASSLVPEEKSPEEGSTATPRPTALTAARTRTESGRMGSGGGPSPSSLPLSHPLSSQHDRNLPNNNNNNNKIPSAIFSHLPEKPITATYGGGGGGGSSTQKTKDTEEEDKRKKDERPPIIPTTFSALPEVEVTRRVREQHQHEEEKKTRNEGGTTSPRHRHPSPSLHNQQTTKDSKHNHHHHHHDHDDDADANHNNHNSNIASLSLTPKECLPSPLFLVLPSSSTSTPPACTGAATSSCSSIGMMASQGNQSLSHATASMRSLRRRQYLPAAYLSSLTAPPPKGILSKKSSSSSPKAHHGKHNHLPSTTMASHPFSSSSGAKNNSVHFCEQVLISSGTGGNGGAPPPLSLQSAPPPLPCHTNHNHSRGGCTSASLHPLIGPISAGVGAAGGGGRQGDGCCRSGVSADGGGSHPVHDPVNGGIGREGVCVERETPANPQWAGWLQVSEAELEQYI